MVRFEVLQGEHPETQLYKFSVRSNCNIFPFFKEVLNNLILNELVVMKVFISDVLAKFYVFSEAPFGLDEVCIKRFMKEASCYGTIKNHDLTVVNENYIIKTPILKLWCFNVKVN